MYRILSLAIRKYGTHGHGGGGMREKMLGMQNRIKVLEQQIEKLNNAAWDHFSLGFSCGMLLSILGSVMLRRKKID